MVGLIVSIDDMGRVTLPRELTVAWLPKKKLMVVAELSEPGLFRIYRLEDIAAHIESLREQIETLESSAQAAKTNALEDIYRQLTVYADGRLQLTKEVASWIGHYPFPTEASQLFAEAFATGISIFTLEYRVSRSSKSGLAIFDGHLRAAASKRKGSDE